MMKRIFLLTASLILSTSLVYAHPPSSIEADYLEDEDKLYVLMNHLSRDQHDHYIRKTEITVNGKNKITESNRKQIDPNQYGFSRTINAKENDEITIKAYCKEGGVKSISLVVPEKEEGEQKETQRISEIKNKVIGFKAKRTDVGVYGSKSGVYDSKKEVFDAQADPFKSKGEIYGSKIKPIGEQVDVYGSKKEAVEGKGSGY